MQVRVKVNSGPIVPSAGACGDHSQQASRPHRPGCSAGRTDSEGLGTGQEEEEGHWGYEQSGDRSSFKRSRTMRTV